MRQESFTFLAELLQNCVFLLTILQTYLCSNFVRVITMRSTITRRQFLAAAAFSSVAAFSKYSFAASKAVKPDILLIMPDQMRGDCLSILGHPAVQTPQMDQLAKDGTLFRRAYTTVTSCIPARHSLLSGLYPQTSGAVGFRARPFSTPTMPKLVADAGYSTVLVGRNMHQPPQSGDCGYQKRILGSTYVKGDDYDNFLRKAAPQTGGIRKLISDLGIDCNLWRANPWPLNDNLHPTAWTVTQSRKAVKDADKDKPLFLTASFYAPHPPLFPPKKYFDKYMNSKLPNPARGEWVDWGKLSPKGDSKGHRILLEGETLKRAQAGYFGLIENLDDQIASLIEDFKARSEKAGRPWVIAVFSDHGEMLGDHGYFRKCEPFEGSANIPFIITASKSMGFKKGTRVNQPVCLEDIMPTMLELAGVRTSVRFDGVRLVDTLKGRKQNIRKWLHFEHATCYSKEQAYHALTDGHYKYIWRPLNGTEHLFDLQTDPTEVQDLAKENSHAETLNQWRNRMIKRLAKRPEGFVKNGKLIPGRPYKALNKGTLPQQKN